MTTKLFLQAVTTLLILQSQMTWAACSAASDPQRFDTSLRGVLVDTSSGLVWRRCPAGQDLVDNSCHGEALDLSWNDADAESREIANGENIQWRLPTLEEMDTILHSNCGNQILPTEFPIPLPEEIWTSSPGFPVNDVAAIVNLESGEIFGTGKGVKRAFLLVADSADGL